MALSEFSMEHIALTSKIKFFAHVHDLVISFLHIMCTLTAARKRLRDEFSKNRHVTDPDQMSKV